MIHAGLGGVFPCRSPSSYFPSEGQDGFVLPEAHFPDSPAWGPGLAEVEDAGGGSGTKVLGGQNVQVVGFMMCRKGTTADM